MKTIPETYSKNGYNYRLIERTAKAAIYGQHMGSRLIAYEVVKVRVRAGRESEVNGRNVVFEAGEYLPSTEEWGRFGWTYPVNGGLEPAQARFHGLNANSETPHKIPA